MHHLLLVTNNTLFGIVIVIKNVLPFLELPSYTFELGDREDEEDDSDNEDDVDDFDDDESSYWIANCILSRTSIELPSLGAGGGFVAQKYVNIWMVMVYSGSGTT